MSVIVEMSGDEAKLLRSLQKTIQKQAEYEAKLKQTETAGTAMGEGLERGFNKAKDAGDKALKGSLQDLRRFGPEGQAMAKALKSHFQETEQAGEKSMQSILDELRKISPEAAAVARSAGEDFEKAGMRGESAFGKFGKSAIGQITSIVGAYVGVQEAISLVNEFLETQRDLIRDAKDAQIDLAAAQQEAAKNLAGLNLIQRNDLLSNAVPEIAAQTGFSDAKAITTALGSVASAGESDPEKIKQAVLQAARVTRLTPDALEATAGAGSAISRAAGLSDIREGLALVQTTGTQAKITDPTKLQQTLPLAVGNLVSTVRQQDPQEAAREAAAFFAQVTQSGQDQEGRSSATFATDFGIRLDKFFTGLEEEQIKARSRIQVLSGKANQTEKDRLDIQRAEEFLAASEGVTDPADFFDRIKIIQDSAALEKQFVGEGFGEKQFQTFLKDVFDEGSDLAGALKTSKDVIQANVDFFEREAGEQLGSTPALSLAGAAASTAGNVQGLELSDTEAATLAQIRASAGAAFDKTRGGFFDKSSDFAEKGFLSGTTAAEEAVDAVSILQDRIEGLDRDGLTAQEAVQKQFLEREISNLIELIGRQGDLGAIDESGVGSALQAARARLRGQFVGGGPGAAPTLVAPSAAEAEVFERMISVLERIESKTSQTADNTTPQPQVGGTGPLSSNQP